MVWAKHRALAFSASRDPPISVPKSFRPIVTPDIRDELLAEIARLERCLLEARLALEPEPTAKPGSGAVIIDENRIRRLLVARRIRDTHLGDELFADPAWDLLLQAFAADLGQKRMSVSELCEALTVPHSVTRRWIKKLEEDGYFRRREAPDELVELTTEGSARLRRYFEIVGPTLLLV